MKKAVILLALTAAAMTGTAVQAGEKLSGEQRLSKMLEGRTAGAPVDCIPLHRTRNMQIIDRTAIVYDTGRTIYVNRPRNPQTLDSDDILVTRPTNSELCRLDSVQTRDRSQFFFNGTVMLDQFVPYRRVAAAN